MLLFGGGPSVLVMTTTSAAAVQVCHLPVLATPVVAVAFCPSLLALRPSQPAGTATAPAAATDGSDTAAGQPADQQKASAGSHTDGKGPVQLPYRMVFAVATAESVILYDTQVCFVLSAAVISMWQLPMC